jgi:hypothetical protein
MRFSSTTGRVAEDEGLAGELLEIAGQLERMSNDLAKMMRRSELLAESLLRDGCRRASA